jgi:hypothetical protein
MPDNKGFVDGQHSKAEPYVEGSNRLLGAFGFLVLSYVFVDFVRRFFSGNPWLLMVLDVAIATIFLCYLTTHSKNLVSWKLVRSSFFLVLLLFILVVILQGFNQTFPSIKLTLAGLRTYLMPIPFLFIGYIFFSRLDTRQHEVIVKFLKVILVTVVAFALMQMSLDTDELSGNALLAFSSMTPGTHNYEDKMLLLTTSFFAGSKRYASFLLLSYLVVWGILKDQGKSVRFISIVVLVGLVIGGARDALWLFLFFHVCNLFFNKPFVFFIALAGFIVMSFAMSQVYEDHIWVRFLLGADDNLLGRLRLLFPIANINFDSPYAIFGIGPGHYGAEATLIPKIYQTNEIIVSSLYKDLNPLFGLFGFDDAGLVKIHIELGLPGLFVYGSLIVVAVIIAIHTTFTTKSKLSISLAYYVLIYILLCLKSHQFISNIFMASVFYFAMGHLLFTRDNEIAGKAS